MLDDAMRGHGPWTLSFYRKGKSAGVMETGRGFPFSGLPPVDGACAVQPAEKCIVAHRQGRQGKDHNRSGEFIGRQPPDLPRYRIRRAAPCTTAYFQAILF